MQKICPGDRFGRLTIIHETTKEERKYKGGRNYLCRCDCGNEVIVYGAHLKRGDTKSCGCLSREIASKNNSTEMHTGDVFGELTIIDRAPIRGNGLAYWKCQCSCGKIVEVAGTYLRDGSMTSCGCLKYPNRINEIGNQYGLLTVIDFAGSKENGGAIWKCVCSCGKEVLVRGDQLRSGKTTSCGHIASYPEWNIANLLEKYNISYARQYSFPDLRGFKGGLLRFDFAIFRHEKLICLIEYQGSQHYDKNSSWYTNEGAERDKLKIEYCNKNNIMLLIWDKNTNLDAEIAALAERAAV